MIFGIFDAISFFTEVRRQYLNCIPMVMITFPFLKKRDHFFLRCISAFLSVSLVAVALMFLNLTPFVGHPFSSIFIYGFSVAAEFLIFWMLFDVDFISLLYRYIISSAIGTMTSILFGKIIADFIFSDTNAQFILYTVYMVATSFLVSGLFAFFFRGGLAGGNSVIIGSKRTSVVFYSFLYVFFYAITVLSYAPYYYITDSIVRYFGFVGTFLCCLVTLFLLFEIQHIIQLNKDKEILEKMWYDDRKRYELQKEAIENINFKCHDLRHQIRAITENGNLNEKAVKDIENSIRIYDSMADTGNQVANVVLSDCGLRCQKNNIQLTYIIDGEKLSFIDEIDLYSIFGNALENAVDYELTVPEKEGRFIFASVRQEKKELFIHFENYCREELSFQNGLPVTTKGDTKWHGFGMKSMKNIVSKYRGKMTVKRENNMFQLDISMPAP